MNDRKLNENSSDSVSSSHYTYLLDVLCIPSLASLLIQIVGTYFILFQTCAISTNIKIDCIVFSFSEDWILDSDVDLYNRARLIIWLRDASKT